MIIAPSKRVTQSGLKWTFAQTIVLLTVILGGGNGIVPLPQPARACPMCSENLSSDTQPKVPDTGNANRTLTENAPSLATGFYYSILLMLAVPFSMMAALGGALYLRIRKVATARSTAAPSPHPRSTG